MRTPMPLSHPTKNTAKAPMIQGHLELLEGWLADGLARMGFQGGRFNGGRFIYVPSIQDVPITNMHTEAGLVFVPLPHEPIDASAEILRDGHELACAIAAAYTKRDLPLPLSLQRYVVEAAQGTCRRRRGRDVLANLARDVAITVAVLAACRHGALKPARNEASEHECGCSIVSKALARVGMDMPEPTVVKAYQRALKFRKHGA